MTNERARSVYVGDPDHKIAVALNSTRIFESLFPSNDSYDIRLFNVARNIDRIINEYYQTDQRSPQWSVLKGLRVLDIGSGSMNSASQFMIYYPQFARLCAMNGAKVTAIDNVKQSSFDHTLFREIVTDVIPSVNEGRFSQVTGLAGEEFDIINSRYFVGWNPDPHVYNRLHNSFKGLAAFESALIEECGKITAENGVVDLDFEDHYFRKLNGELIMQQRSR